MGLPARLYSSYKQSKHDTDFVATWLAQTAKATGYQGSLGVMQDNSITQEGSSSAGAKKAEHAGAKVTICVGEFIGLAKHIANLAQPGVDVPESLLNTLRRAIKARQATTKHYTETDHDDSTHVYTHIYF